MTGSGRVLVTGVRGKTGVPLAGLLAARGVEVLGGSSDPARVDLRGVRPTAFSWDEPAGWSAALEGVDAAYVVRPDRADAPELIAALLDGAPREMHVVLLSEQGAAFAGPGAWAPRAEAVVRGSDLPWTVLRPSWFMQVFTDPRFYRDPIHDDGELAFPGGGAEVAWVDARDIAAVAERVLLDPGRAGQVHEITGPVALTLPRTAAELSAALGHRVRHREVSIAEAVAGDAGFLRELSVLTFEKVAAGSYGSVTDTVEQVTGCPARSLATFLGDETAALAR